MKARDKALLATTVTALLVSMTLFAISCLGRFLRGPVPRVDLPIASTLHTRVFSEAAVVDSQPLGIGNPTTEPESARDGTLPATANEHAQAQEDKICSNKTDSHGKPKSPKADVCFRD